MVWEPGQSGNPNGRPKGKVKPWRDALERAVQKMVETPEGKRPRLELIAEACVTEAEKGEAAAYTEIGNRLDGKAVQQQILTGDEDGGPVRFATVERHIIDPKAEPQT